jgi:hypothetical protein
MKLFILPLFLAVTACTAEDGAVSGLSLKSLATKDGTAYSAVEITRWTVAGVSVTHKDGTAQIAWEQLPDNVVTGLKKRGVPLTRKVEKAGTVPAGGHFKPTLKDAGASLLKLGFTASQKRSEGDTWLEAKRAIKGASNVVSVWPELGSTVTPVETRPLHKVQFQTSAIPLDAEDEGVKAVGDAAELAGKDRKKVEEWARVVSADKSLAPRTVNRFETEIDGMSIFLAVNPGLVFIGHVEALPETPKATAPEKPVKSPAR